MILAERGLSLTVCRSYTGLRHDAMLLPRCETPLPLSSLPSVRRRCCAQSKECRSPADAERYIAKALEVAVTESARQRLVRVDCCSCSPNILRAQASVTKAAVGNQGLQQTL